MGGVEREGGGQGGRGGKDRELSYPNTDTPVFGQRRGEGGPVSGTEGYKGGHASRAAQGNNEGLCCEVNVSFQIRSCSRYVQGYLAHEKPLAPKILKYDQALGPMVVLWWSLGGGGRFLMSEVPLYTIYRIPCCPSCRTP